MKLSNCIALIAVVFILYMIYYKECYAMYRKEAFKRSGNVVKGTIEMFVPRVGSSVISGSNKTMAPLVPGPNAEQKLNSKSVLPTVQIAGTEKKFDSEKKYMQRDLLRSRGFK